MSGAPASEKPTLVGNDIVQQIKDGPPKAAGKLNQLYKYRNSDISFGLS